MTSATKQDASELFRLRSEEASNAFSEYEFGEDCYAAMTSEWMEGVNGETLRRTCHFETENDKGEFQFFVVFKDDSTEISLTYEQLSTEKAHRFIQKE